MAKKDTQAAAAAASTLRVPMQSVTVVRDGAAMTPTIGTPFEFTADEIEQIERMNPAAISAMASVDLTKVAPKSEGEKEAL